MTSSAGLSILAVRTSLPRAKTALRVARTAVSGLPLDQPQVKLCLVHADHDPFPRQEVTSAFTVPGGAKVGD